MELQSCWHNQAVRTLHFKPLVLPTHICIYATWANELEVSISTTFSWSWDHSLIWDCAGIYFGALGRLSLLWNPRCNDSSSGCPGAYVMSHPGHCTTWKLRCPRSKKDCRSTGLLPVVWWPWPSELLVLDSMLSIVLERKSKCIAYLIAFYLEALSPLLLRARSPRGIT